MKSPRQPQLAFSGHRMKIPALTICSCARASVLGLALLAAPDLYAQTTRTWDNGAGTNDWGTAANWSGDTLPVNGDTVIINNGNTVYANLSIPNVSITLSGPEASGSSAICPYLKGTNSRQRPALKFTRFFIPLSPLRVSPYFRPLLLLYTPSIAIPLCSAFALQDRFQKMS